MVENCVDLDNKIYSNNAIFLNNKFIRDDDKTSTIEQLHPVAWKEPWKENKALDTTGIAWEISTIKDLKRFLIEKNIMKELKEEDYEVN